jgi:hypothetical protein
MTNYVWIALVVVLFGCVVRIMAGPTAIDRDLLAACLGDRSQADRLIDFEIKRRPSLSRRDAAIAALDRMRRDAK